MQILPLGHIIRTKIGNVSKKGRIVVRSHDDLYRGNKTVLSLTLLKYARSCQQYNKYFTISILFIVVIDISLPVTLNTLPVSCKVRDNVFRLKQITDFLERFS
jgi:hypothetical protein